MTFKDVVITKTTTCAGCDKKMHHGHKGIAAYNKKGKVKAYYHNDDCTRSQP